MQGRALPRVGRDGMLCSCVLLALLLSQKVGSAHRHVSKTAFEFRPQATEECGLPITVEVRLVCTFGSKAPLPIEEFAGVSAKSEARPLDTTAVLPLRDTRSTSTPIGARWGRL